MLMTHGTADGPPGGTFSHEYGHYFNLYHTFEGTENGNNHVNAENVARFGAQSNCSSKGDLLCDTNADPQYSESAGTFNNSTCSVTAHAQDIHNVTYIAPIGNIMSYYPGFCGTSHFTSDQYTRVAQGLAIRLGHNTYSIQASPQSVNVPTGLDAVFNESSGEVDLTWNDVASNEMGYVIERSSTSSSSGFVALVNGGVGPGVEAYSDASASPTTTYWYRIKPTNGDKDTYSFVKEVETGLVYCSAGATGTFCADPTAEYIKRVQIGSLDNPTGCSGTGFYTSYSGMAGADVDKGVGTMLTVTNNTTIWGIQDQCNIFVDWNQDGDFLDSDETISVTGSPGGGPYTSMITPPASAALGKTRMRVRISYGAGASCGNVTWGEVEDYSLNVAAVLPIQLAEFVGRAEKNKINLSWKTEVELNNKSFEIERWNTEKQQFDYTGALAGAGTTEIEQRYHFVDYHPRKEANLYRLKQIDFDGEFTYSDVISVEWNGEERLSLYPNPASDRLNINIINPIDEELSYSILNTLGQVQGRSQVLMNNANLEVDISQLPTGVYYLKLESAQLGIIGEWFTKL